MSENKGTEKTSLGTKIKNHKVLSVVILLLALLCIYRIGAFIYDTVTPDIKDDSLVAVKTVTADYATISKATPMSGRITATEEAAIIPMAAGQVTKVNVKVGDYVKAGTVLFEIDKAAVAGTYTQAKAAYDLAKKNFDNITMLYNEGAISKTEYEGARVQFISSQETYKLAAEQYSNYNPSTPIDGYVTSLNVSVGNMVSSAQMAASVANTDQLEISTTASEYVAGLLHVGDTVDVTVDNNRDKTYSGVVETLSPAPAYGTYTYPITIALDNTSGELMSGQFAEVSINAEEAKNAICVPSDAVIMKGGQTIVVILDGDNKASFSEVTTGIDNGELVEIISGVKKGDTVIISGQDFVEDGAIVKVLE